MKKHVEEIYNLAKQAYDLDEVPVGAVVIDETGGIIGKGHNFSHTHKDSVDHAEIIALKDAFKTKGDWRLNNCKLIVNLEPCLMCLGAANNARISEIVYFLKDKQFGSVESKFTEEQIKEMFPKIKISKYDDGGVTKELLQKFLMMLINS